MSTERTLMSWNRTSLSLISFGFTIYQFFDKFQQATLGANAPHPDAPRNLGLALILIGTIGTVIALWQYYRVVAYLKGEEFKAIGTRDELPHWDLTFVVAVFSALIGLATTVWILSGG
jgi:putative membrane protein